MKFNWGMGIATAYIVFALGIIVLVVIASRQHYDLVSNDYYDEAVRYQSKIDAMNNSTTEHTSVTIDYLQASHAIRIEAGQKDMSGKISFYKPDNASADFSFNFALHNGIKVIDKTLSSGLWKINARWKVNGKDCYEERKLYVARP